MFKINIKKSIAVYIKAKHINSKTRMVKGMLTVESDILQALVNRDHAICNFFKIKFQLFIQSIKSAIVYNINNKKNS